MPNSKLRILCFGDSLTEGYSGWGSRFTPYSTKLGEMLRMAFPDVEVEIVTDGLSGDLVTGTGSFLPRFKSHCKSAFLTRYKLHDNCLVCTRDRSLTSSYTVLPKNPADYKPFDWAIVLGGTNDLGSNIHAEQIFEGLEEIWDLALFRKCKVLALTVPEIELSAGRMKEVLEFRRNELNDMIKSYKKPN